ncbi:MAG: energy-coupling factor transporter transmembrane component T [Pseudomonadota bacterium]
MTAHTAIGTVASRNPVAAVDIRVKYALCLLASTLIFVWNNIWLQATFLGFIVALMVMAGIPRKTMRRLVLILIPAVILTTIIQGLWSPLGETPIFTVPINVPILGGLKIFYVEGVVFGLVVGCRILAPMLAFQLVYLTSEPSEIVLGLVRLGVPYRIAFLVSTTFRFVPLLLEEWNAIKDAQRLRGIDIDSFGLMRKLVAMGRMLVPLVMICLNKAQMMEIALQAKGFTGSSTRTYLNPGRERLNGLEWVLIGAAFTLFASALIARLAFGFGGSVI